MSNFSDFGVSDYIPGADLIGDVFKTNVKLKWELWLCCGEEIKVRVVVHQPNPTLRVLSSILICQHIT